MATISTVRRVVEDPNILDGEPTLHGTRIPVRAVILAWRDHHHDVKRIQPLFTSLTKADLEEAIRYYAQHRERIDEYIAANDLEGYLPEEREELRCPPPPST